MQNVPMLDERDRKILDLMQANAEMAVNDIADAVALSASACSRRIARLREEGYIARSVAMLDRKKVGLPTTVFVIVRTGKHEAGWLEEFHAAVSTIPEIVEVHRLTGNFDYIIKLVLRGEPFSMPTGGDHCLQFIHVDDVVQAAIRASEVPMTQGYVFNVTGGGYWSLHEAAAIIRKSIPDARIDIGSGVWHLDRQGPWDIGADERELGYRASWTLEDGVRQYVDWLRHNEY